MGDLRDQLLKSGLVSKKRKRAADREARTQEKRLGARGLAERREKRQDQFEEREADRRHRDQNRGQDLRIEQVTHEQRLRCRSLIESGIVREGRRGPRRFYFVSRSGRIPFISLSAELARDIEQGRCAIVEYAEGLLAVFEVVGRPTAERIDELEPEAIRFWNR